MPGPSPCRRQAARPTGAPLPGAGRSPVSDVQPEEGSWRLPVRPKPRAGSARGARRSGWSPPWRSPPRCPSAAACPPPRQPPTSPWRTLRRRTRRRRCGPVRTSTRARPDGACGSPVSRRGPATARLQDRPSSGPAGCPGSARDVPDTDYLNGDAAPAHLPTVTSPRSSLRQAGFKAVSQACRSGSLRYPRKPP